MSGRRDLRPVHPPIPPLPLVQPTILTRPRLVRYTATGAGLVDHPIASEDPSPAEGKLISSSQRGIIHPHSKGPTFVNRNLCATGAVRAQVYVNSGVRVGNWRETSLSLQKHMSELVEKEKRGELGSARIARRVAVAEAPAPLAPILVYNVPLVLQNLYTLGMLAVDASDLSLADLTGSALSDSPVPPSSAGSSSSQRGASTPLGNAVFGARAAGLASGEVSPTPIQVTCTHKNPDPVRRTVFTFEKAESWDGDKQAGGSGSILYGDKFYIKACDIVPGTELFLHSAHKSATCFSKHSKSAPVTLLPFRSSAALWQFVTVNKDMIMERQGRAVEPGHHLVLSHCITHNFLMADPRQSFRNDHGVEMEVSAKRGTELAPEEKSHIQWVVWVDDPSLVQDVEDLEVWQSERNRISAPPSRAALG
ncbi:hypothetical protein BC828DRAFT_411805 [Blastocladiella britannica]|nr:hypothetical protein BC828DRAFT_411805 [Blastocladiella britannica]